MKRYLAGTALVIFLVIGGCSIHPDQQDVTNLDTYEIAKKIRCEARDSLKFFFFDQLAEVPEVLAQIKNKTYSFNEFNEDRKSGKLKLSKKLKDTLDRYDGALIAYNFAFTITEENNTTTGVTLFSGYRRGLTKSGLSASGNRARQSVHTFKIFETFEQTLVKLKDSDCEYEPEKNFIYPIAGDIDLHPVIKRFFYFTNSGTLTGASDDIPAYSAKLEFTTKFIGSVNPVMELASLGRSTNLVAANLNALSSREDKHAVTIVLTLPAEKPAPKPGPKGKKKGVTIRNLEPQILKSLREFNNIDAITDGQINREIRDAIKRLPPQ